MTEIYLGMIELWFDRFGILSVISSDSPWIKLSYISHLMLSDEPNWECPPNIIHVGLQGLQLLSFT